MRRALGLISAALLSGCWSFEADLSFCRDAGGCRPVDAPGGGGGGGGGGGAAGGGEGGGGGALSPQDGGFTVSPVFSTPAGWGWEFPWPAGPGLHHVVALSDDEAWASGDDDTVLHLVAGRATFSRLPRSASPAVKGGVLLPDALGGVWATSPDQLFRSADGGWARAGAVPFAPSAAAWSTSGVPLFGGQLQAVSGACAPRGVGVFEGVPASAPTCLLGNVDAWLSGLDAEGWALDSTGGVWHRLNAGQWVRAVVVDGGYYDQGDLLALPSGELILVGLTGASSRVLRVDGGLEGLSFEAGGRAESWTSLARTSSQGAFFIAGKPGLLRCSSSAPFDAGTCVLEYADLTESLESVSAGTTTAFAVGDDSQVLQRDADGTWRTVVEGGAGVVTDVWGDPATGELWAVTRRATLLERRADGWVRHPGPRPDEWLQTLTRAGGVLWVFGTGGIYRWESGQLIAVDVAETDGGTFTIPGSGLDFSQAAGSELGNTWVASSRGMFRLREDGTWVRDNTGTCPSQHVASVWVSDAGTAWIAGGYQERLVCQWDGTQWLDRTPSGMGEFTGLWGAGPSDVYVGGVDTSGYHFLPDGGVQPWTHEPVASLAGAWASDGGFVLFGGIGSQVWRAPNGVRAGVPRELSAPKDAYLTRVRVVGPKVFAMGDRDRDRSWLLSFDAGL